MYSEIARLSLQIVKDIIHDESRFYQFCVESMWTTSFSKFSLARIYEFFVARIDARWLK